MVKDDSANHRERRDVLRGRQPRRQLGDGGELWRSGPRIAYPVEGRKMRVARVVELVREAALDRLALITVRLKPDTTTVSVGSVLQKTWSTRE